MFSFGEMTNSSKDLMFLPIHEQTLKKAEHWNLGSVHVTGAASAMS